MLIGSASPPISDPCPDTRSLLGVPRSRGVARRTKADYRGAVVATCETIWWKRLLKDLQEEVSDPTTIYCDNLSIIQLAKNPVFHAWTKNIEVHYHFFRERVHSSEVELQYVPTDRQPANIFTNPLGLDKLWQFSGALSCVTSTC